MDGTLEDAVERAQLAWDEGKPEEAARILEEWTARHPERAHEVRGRGVRAPDAPPPPPERPASLPCLRCASPMPYRGAVRLHEGRNLAPFLLGDAGELLVDAVHFDVYGCGECGHVELFLPGLARDARPPGAGAPLTPAPASAP